MQVNDALIDNLSHLARLEFSPEEKDWWEYLDQIWEAAETAERTSLTVLPALMLRARKQSASQDSTAS